MSHKQIHFILVATVLALTAPARGESLTAAKAKNSEPAAEGEEPWWNWAFTLQAADLVDEVSPAAEIQKRIGQKPNHPHSLSIAYWSMRKTTTNSSSSYQAAADGDRKDRFTLDALSARYKLYLTRSFHFNFGAGIRSLATKESVKFPTGETITAEKSATSLGLDIGLGNRWVLPFGGVLGGNWLEVFVPGPVLKSKDASLPDGYSSGRYSGTYGSKKSDATRFSLRIAVVDLGYAW